MSDTIPRVPDEAPGPAGRALLSLLPRLSTVITAALIFVIIAAAGVMQLIVSDDYRAYFNPDDPERLAFETLENTYTQNYDVQIVLAPKNGRVFTRDTLTTVEAITEAGWQVPFAIRVDSVTNYQRIESRGDSIHVHDLVTGAAHLSSAEIDRLRRQALTEPALVNRLLSPKAHITAVQISLSAHERKPDDNGRIMEAVREIVKKAAARHPDIEFHLSGLAAYDHAFVEATLDDSATLLPLAYGMVIVLLFVILRSVSMTGAVLGVIVAASAAAMGIGGWFGMPITSASAVAPLVILTVCVADAMHLLSGYRDALWRMGDRTNAMRAALSASYRGVALTNLTTVIGFLTMNFSDSPPLRDLGNLVAIGVAITMVLSLAVLPALIVRLPHHIPVKRPIGHQLAVSIGDFVVRRRQLLLWSGIPIAMVLAAATTLNSLEDNFVEYFDESYEFRRSADLINRELTGIDTIEFSIGAKGHDGVKDPAWLGRLDNFSRWLESQPGVIHVSSVLDVIKRLNRSMHGDNRNYYAIPPTRELVGQYLLVYEFSLPRGLDLNNQMNLDRSAARVTVTLRGLTTTQVIALEEAARAWLKTHATPEMFAYGTSPTLMFAHIAERNIDGMLEGSIYEIVAITLVLALALRSLRMGFMSLIPNVLPALMAFGVWGVLVGRVGLAASVVSSMALGIIVDDTVHLLSRYQLGRRGGLSPEDSVRYAFEEVGAAMLLTTLILLMGFGVLALSGFTVNHDLGALTTITIGIALICDFTFVPAILMRLDKRIPAIVMENQAVADDRRSTFTERRSASTVTVAHFGREAVAATRFGREAWMLGGSLAIAAIGLVLVGIAFGLRREENLAGMPAAPSNHAVAAAEPQRQNSSRSDDYIRRLEEKLDAFQQETRTLRERLTSPEPQTEPPPRETTALRAPPPAAPVMADDLRGLEEAEALIEAIPETTKKRSAVRAPEPVKRPPPPAAGAPQDGFSTNPCKGAAAQFTSTCQP